MAIPNTTPTPNELFNGEMKRMSDAELRVVMIVTRATYGWVLDEEKGLRKEEDWISLSQMVEKSGKSIRAIKYAVQGCIDKEWIEARNEDGELLDTGEKRQKYGKKIFYRLGPTFTRRIKKITSANNAQATSANDDTKPVQKKTKTSAKKDNILYKRNFTKEIITKESANAQNNKKELLRKMGFNVKDGGASYEWQDWATRYAKSLSIKPSPSWFKLFKRAFQLNQKGILQATYTSISDLSPNDPERYFYKVFNQKLSG